VSGQFTRAILGTYIDKLVQCAPGFGIVTRYVQNVGLSVDVLTSGCQIYTFLEVFMKWNK